MKDGCSLKIKIEHLNHSFGTQKILNDLSFESREIKSLAIIGPSGSGKSTLLRVLGGLIQAQSGRIEINGEELKPDEKSLFQHRKKVGTVFQDFNLFSNLNAFENIILPLVKVHGLSREEAESRAQELVKRFQLEPHAKKKPAQLSGGQKQRFAIVRAVAIQPQLLLLDEPTSALDPEMTAEVLHLIEELKSENKDFILVTHNIAFSERVANDILFLSEGAVRDYGHAEAVLKHSKSIEVQTFLRKILI